MPNTATTIIMVLIGMWAMVMHIVTAALNERQNFSIGRFFAGSYFFERYNRKYLLVFCSIVAFQVAVVIIVNIRWLKGIIDL